MLSQFRRRWDAVSDKNAVRWLFLVIAVYSAATVLEALGRVGQPDRMMTLAANMWQGRFDVGDLTRLNDIVVVNGRNYEAISLGPVLPYLPLVPFKALWPLAGWLVDGLMGIVAASLALPVARRYGPGGKATYWLAALGAFGILVFTQATAGNFYYLAQVEAVACTFVVLIEWRGRRRPWLMGLAFGLAALARPTLLLAAVPFGLAILYTSTTRTRAAIAYSVPILATLALTGLFNMARFGSPLETGYAISIVNPELAARRAQGLFSLEHLPDNLYLLVLGGFGLRRRFPFLAANQNGHSLLLTSPALLIALRAGFRDRTAQLLWAATAVVAVPILLYYGYGGPLTYGYRYTLDFTPFLFALAAMGARCRFGKLEMASIVLSCVFVGYGLLWRRFA